MTTIIAGIFGTMVGLYVGVMLISNQKVVIDSIDEVRQICIAQNKKFFMLSGSVNDTKYPYHCSNELAHGVEMEVE